MGQGTKQPPTDEYPVRGWFLHCGCVRKSATPVGSMAIRSPIWRHYTVRPRSLQDPGQRWIPAQPFSGALRAVSSPSQGCSGHVPATTRTKPHMSPPLRGPRTSHRPGARHRWPLRRGPRSALRSGMATYGACGSSIHGSAQHRRRRVRSAPRDSRSPPPPSGEGASAADARQHPQPPIEHSPRFQCATPRGYRVRAMRSTNVESPGPPSRWAASSVLMPAGWQPRMRRPCSGRWRIHSRTRRELRARARCTPRPDRLGIWSACSISSA